MEDIRVQQSRFSGIDLPDQDTKFALKAQSEISVKNVNGGVEVIYVNQEGLYKVSGKKCILACYNGIILGAQMLKAKEALANVSSSCLDSGYREKLAYVRNKGISRAIGQLFFNNMYIDFPVSIGGLSIPSNL